MQCTWRRHAQCAVLHIYKQYVWIKHTHTGWTKSILSAYMRYTHIRGSWKYRAHLRPLNALVRVSNIYVHMKRSTITITTPFALMHTTYQGIWTVLSIFGRPCIWLHSRRPDGTILRFFDSAMTQRCWLCLGPDTPAEKYIYEWI